MTVRRERFTHGNAQAERRPGDDFWSISVGGSPKGSVWEKEGRFEAVGVTGQQGSEIRQWSSLGRAIDSLIGED